MAAGLLNAGQNALTAHYSFLGLVDEINVLLQNEYLIGTHDQAGSRTLEAVARLYGVLDGKTHAGTSAHQAFPRSCT